MIYILSKTDLSIKDSKQVSDYSIENNINLNGKSSFILASRPNAEKGDYIKYHNFIGIISRIESNKGYESCKIHVDDINSLFDRKIILSNDSLISSTGLEDFIAEVITDRWISTGDSLLNIDYINLTVSTHTPYNFTVETQDGVYNFLTFLGNVKEYYGIELDYSFTSTQLNITISKKNYTELDIDLSASDVVNYDEVYSVDIIAKVVVKSNESNTETNYYLLNDRTISTDVSNVNRVIGDVEMVVCEKDVDVYQKAVDTFKSNRYNHNIAFDLISDSKLYEVSELFVNRPLRIKTRLNGVYNTFIAKESYTLKSKVIQYECGNMKVKLTDKLKGV